MYKESRTESIIQNYKKKYKLFFNLSNSIIFNNVVLQQMTTIVYFSIYDSLCAI